MPTVAGVVVLTIAGRVANARLTVDVGPPLVVTVARFVDGAETILYEDAPEVADHWDALIAALTASDPR